VLVTAGFVAKLADFGESRDVDYDATMTLVSVMTHDDVKAPHAPLHSLALFSIIAGRDAHVFVSGRR
jgi:hypothetical protein